MNKLLTIAIPTYNRKNYLNRAIDSVVSQMDDRVEILVSDNCSEDGTEEFIKTNYPQVTYYKNEKNVGMENFQRCYKRANGKFILLLGDDDIVTEGSLKVILDFLEDNEDLSLLFLNHTSYYMDYIDVEHCGGSFFDDKMGNFATTDKDRFINIARHQLTFMSCMVLSKDKYLKVNNPDQYNENWFLQTIVAFKVTEDNNSKLGIISKVCIAQGVFLGSQSNNMDVQMDVFGICEYDVFCRIGVESGYDKSTMVKIYGRFIAERWPGLILRYKACGYDWKNAFWKKGYPIVKKLPNAIIPVLIAAFTPVQLAKIAYYIKKKTRE